MTGRLFKHYPLLFRLVWIVFAFSLLVALLVSALQVWIGYNNELAGVRHNLKELQVSVADSLTNDLWNLDREGLEIQLQSMLRYPDVIAVVLLDNEGMTLRAGQVPEDPQHLILNRFVLSKFLSGRDTELGEVIIYATTSQLKKRLWQQVSASLVAELVALLLTAGFILGIFLLKYNRHINCISEFAEGIGVDTLDQQLQLDRVKNPDSQPDELDRIVFSLNNMRKRLKDGILAQQSVEKNLQRETEFSDAIINSLPGVFAVYDKNMRAIRFNDLYLEKMGIRAEKASEYRIVDRVVPKDRKRFLQAVRDLFTSPQPLVLEVEMLSLENTPVPHLITGRLFELEGEKYLIGMSTDITSQKKIEEDLRQSQKMEAIGTLAGGIAHDFNNILAAIMGNLELALVANDPEKVKVFLQSALTASVRSKDLVGQILSLSRRSPKEKHPLQVSLLVKEALKLLRASIPSTIAIKQQLDSDSTILADSTQIHQVVMNLCTNGYQAMEDTGGELSIILREEDVTREQLHPSIKLPAGRYLLLEVSDTGCGMDPATMERVFEPYYSTKKSGSGTGLGLAVVQGIVQGHGGFISLYSEQGQGTTVKVFFPLLVEREVVEAQEPEVEEIVDGTERILVVDDEQNILGVFSELLTMHGYTVDTFLDSREALHHFRANPEAYDLVITDMTMPGMTGDILGRKLMTNRPDLPVVLCTGFSKTIGREECLRHGFAAYLAKPVEGRLLLKTLREILDAPQAESLQLLLVEDDRYTQQTARMLLQKQGHRVAVAENGEVALKKLADDHYDGILMDMQMPVLDGLETTKIIRGCEKGTVQAPEFERRTGAKPDQLQGGHIPIIAMTGNLDEESRQSCCQAGMDAFLTKPFTMDSIAHALNSISISGASEVDKLGGESSTQREEGGEEVQEDLPAVVLKHMETVYPLDQEQLQQLLKESVRSLRESLQVAEEAAGRHDVSALATAAHKAKGTLLGLGLDGQVKSARSLEVSAKNNEDLDYALLVARLTNSLHSLLEMNSQ